MKEKVEMMAFLRVALLTRIANVATLAHGPGVKLTRDQFIDLVGRAYDEQGRQIEMELADIESVLAQEDES